MRNRPKQPTGVIVAGIAATLVLIGIAAVIFYFINKPDSFRDSTSEASSCCNCVWSIKGKNNEDIVISSAMGSVSNNTCTFPYITPHIGNYNTTGCSNVTSKQAFSTLPAGILETDIIAAKESRNICTGGCTFYTSDPLIPPAVITSENNDVTFTAYYELRYAVEPHTDYTDAQMEIIYPNNVNSPQPIPASTFELITSNDEIEGTGSESSLLVKVYKATFKTTWDTVLNPDVSGVYTVSFSIHDNSQSDGVWTKSSFCKREFEVVSALREGNYCYSLDAVPVEGTSPLDVTLTVDAGIPKDDLTAAFEWELDLNCNGEIDMETGETAERFTSPANTKSITRRFTLPEGVDKTSCAAKVTVLTKDGTVILENLSEGSCTSSITLTKVSGSKLCGNGICDANETCDTNGNISCPAGTPLNSNYVCRQDCTYCGDGNLDDGESCDPSAKQGQPGYNASCRADCTSQNINKGCGNGILDAGEACDPAIPVGQTGYNMFCQTDCTFPGTSIECGNGVLNAGEECDPAIPPGKTGYSLGCTANCVAGAGQTTSDQLTITQQVPQCVEMVAPRNVASIVTTITNQTANIFKINAISDTLPQGFTYTPGSSTVNGAANASDSGVIVETSGSSQLITWTNGGTGWSVSPAQTITLSFTATAGNSATTGTHANAVTVIPADGDPIPSISNVTVAQVCTQPNTGMFNKNIVVILIGLLLLLGAGMAYYSGFGTHELAKIMQGISSEAHWELLRLTKPQKYSEQKIEQSALKNIKRKTDVRTRPHQKGQK